MRQTRRVPTAPSRLALAPVFAGIACLASQAVAQPAYRCELLRAPEGKAPGGIPTAINRGGDVVGVHADVPRAWNQKGKGRELDHDSLAVYRIGGVNDEGYAVGHAPYIFNQHPEQDVAFIWAPDGTAQRLARFPDQRTVATSINNAGVVAGWSMRSDGPTQATLWDSGEQQILPALKGGKNAQAHQINDKGVVVGQSELSIDGMRATHAVKWVNHRVHDLGALPGHRTSSALALNTRGVIVGYSGSGAGFPVAWVNGVIQPLTPSNHFQPTGTARGVNRHGEIVGDTSTMGATYWPRAGADPVKLDSVIVVDHPCRSAEGDQIPLTSANAINGSGVIVVYGSATSASGETYQAGFRLVPVATGQD